MVQHMCDYEGNNLVCIDPLLNKEFTFRFLMDVRSMPHSDSLYAIAIEFSEASVYTQEDIKANKKTKARRKKPRRFSGAI